MPGISQLPFPFSLPNCQQKMHVFTVLLLLCLFSTVYGQDWVKHIIDENLEGAYGVYVADMDGDDTLDIVASGYSVNSVVWYEAPSWTKHVIDENLPGALKVLVRDMDSDSDFDIIATGWDANSVVWYEAPSWTKHIIDEDMQYASGVHVADMDGDDTLDVLASAGSTDGAAWYKAPSWTKHIIDTSLIFVRSIYAVDLDNDDTLDVLVTGANADSVDRVAWYDVPSWSRHVIDDNIDGADGISVADMDGDEDLDVIATGRYVNDVVWYEAPTWTKHVIDDNLYGARGLFVMDINGDTNPDVIAAGQDADDVIWYEAPLWTKHVIDDNLDGARGIHVADLDGNNEFDVIATGPAANDVLWYESPGLLPPQILVTPDSLSENLMVGDTSQQMLTISNEGLGKLTFVVSLGESEGNYALYFDGVDDYVEISDHVSLDLTNQLTFEAWINPESYTNGGRVAGKYYSSSWSLNWDANYHYLAWEANIGGSSEYNSFASDINLDQWSHIAMTFNSSLQSDQVRLYINGVVDGQYTRSGNLRTDDNPLRIGRGWLPEYFNGIIDEVRIWSVARNQAEIQDYMYKELSGAEAGLAGYWNFNQGSGNTVTDYSTNTNDGSLQGDVSWISSNAPVSNWLNFDPSSGAIPADSSIDLKISYDAAGLNSGIYDADIIIASNDSLKPELIIPIHLIVTGVPDISLSDTLLSFENANIGFPLTDTLLISNTGTDLLTIHDISLDNPDYSTDTTALNLLPGESFNLLVTFTPDTLGLSLATLTISCNDPDEQDIFISLTAEVVTPSNVIVSHTSLSDSLEIGGTYTEIITIKNTGGSLLSFNISCNDHENALEFDGIDDFISIDDSPDFDIGQEGDMTLEIWMSRSNEGTNEGVISHTNGDVGKGWWFAFNEMNEPIFCMMGQWHSNPEIKITKNSCTHVATVISGTLVEFYIDGNYFEGEDMAMSIDDSDADIKIGLVHSEDFGGDPNYFNGIIDEVRLWNITRNQSEILNTMYTDLSGAETGLIGYWKFNEGSGDVIYDKTPNVNNGTLNGGLKWIPSPLKSWLTVSPDSGAVPAGDSLDFEITCDASSLSIGEYEAEILITCSDPNNQQILIPVYIKVTPTGIEGRISTKIPKTYQLNQNYPNPFNPKTIINYELPFANYVELNVYNLLGQKVATLVSKKQHAGYHEVEFNAQKLSSGIYLYRIEAGEWQDVKKMVMLR